MSASSKKKLRKEQNAAAMTEKQQAAAKEAKKMKAYTITFWVVLALCVALVAGVALKAPVTGVMARMTTALVVGDHDVSAVELNYFYIDAINEYVNQYGSWLSYMGLSTSKPLSSQTYDKETGATWADNFLDQAIESAKNTYALYDAAVAANHTLSDEEKESMQSLYDNMDVYAKYYNYNNANDYIAAVYGSGANTETYKAYYEVVVMASSYYAAYTEDLKDSYDDVALRKFEGDETYKYNSYSYASHYLNLDKFKFGGEKQSDGTMKYSDAELKAAEEYIERVAKELANAENNTVEKLNEAIKAMEKQLALDKAAAEKKDTTTEEKSAPAVQTETEPSTDTTEPSTDSTEPSTDLSTPSTDTDNKGEEKEEETEEEEDTTTYSKATETEDQLYSKINSLLQEWIRNADRKEGDITFIKSTSKSTDADGKETETLKGYYIVLYKGSIDNKYALANVRHILVKFEGGTTDKTTGQTTYSEVEKNKAKDEAEKIYNDWLKGDKTEDSFAALAKEKTDDGNGDEGGLYEDVYPGQMVDTFNDWCFDEKREAGDHGIVVTEYGYHIMFYSGDSETNYRDYMVTNDKLTADMEEWQSKLIEATSLTEKNTKFVNKNYIISASTGTSA
ncbi:MAG: peptidylprolyl isomerase [Oscillospiraceae bacterium]|nr:peptidylprolyl isomerase [Oscillospiraceae bacterium]